MKRVAIHSYIATVDAALWIIDLAESKSGGGRGRSRDRLWQRSNSGTTLATGTTLAMVGRGARRHPQCHLVLLDETAAADRF